MNADLVKLLNWSKPHYTIIALILTNLTLWYLVRQRPVAAVSMILIVNYLKNLWKHRIGPEILVNPPDSEDWNDLHAYDAQFQLADYTKAAWNYWVNLREQNHTLWAMGSSLAFIILAQTGAMLSFPVLLFLVINGSFAVAPIFKYIPMPKLQKVQKGRVHQLQHGIPITPCSSTHSMVSRASSEGPVSLTPNLTSMPVHDTGDTSEEEQFLFDQKHFDSASSSSSNSFELI